MYYSERVRDTNPLDLTGLCLLTWQVHGTRDDPSADGGGEDCSQELEMSALFDQLPTHDFEKATRDYDLE